jgi:hypothetical protein
VEHGLLLVAEDYVDGTPTSTGSCGPTVFLRLTGEEICERSGAGRGIRTPEAQRATGFPDAHSLRTQGLRL